ncbi:MAG: hypothetical protein IT580_11345, partial [Verrucomicrobiales bacterium]|nr:hypothetical protein [Verrucomicrobiales bacterium]
ALVACETGQVLWRNEVYLREVPRVKDSDYRDAAHRLFPQRAAPPKKR